MKEVRLIRPLKNKNGDFMYEVTLSLHRIITLKSPRIFISANIIVASTNWAIPHILCGAIGLEPITHGSLSEVTDITASDILFAI